MPTATSPSKHSSAADQDALLAKLLSDIVSKAGSARAHHANEDSDYTLPSHINSYLAAFFLRAAVLQKPLGNAQEDAPPPLTREEVQRLTQECVQRLVQRQSIKDETCKLQIWFETHAGTEDAVAKKARATFQDSLKAPHKALLDAKAHTPAQIEALYRQFIEYILQASSLGQMPDAPSIVDAKSELLMETAPAESAKSSEQTQLAAIRETTSALESVFRPTEIPTFLAQTRQEKEEQVEALVKLVTGIRLFNKALRKGGNSIQSVPEDALKALKAALALATRVEQTADKSKTALLQETAPSEEAKAALLFFRQCAEEAKSIAEQITAAIKHQQTLTETDQATLKELKTACTAKTAVPVEQVFPLFVDLANHWQLWRDEWQKAVFFKRCAETMQYFIDFAELRPFLQEVAGGASGAYFEQSSKPSNEAIIQQAEHLAKLLPQKLAIEILHPRNTTNFWNTRIEYDVRLFDSLLPSIEH